MSDLAPPFTVAEFAAASHGLTQAHNLPGRREKPRASSLGSCARRQAADLAGVAPSNPAPHVLTQEQGRYVEDLTCEVIEHLPHGLTVVDRQIELPDDYPVSGHPDGRLAPAECPESRPLGDGRVWGFEHKHLGRFQYLKTFREGFLNAHPDYMAQLTLYGDALGWDAALVVVLAQDGSSTAYEQRQSERWATTGKTQATRDRHAWATRPDWDAKVLLYAYDLAQYRAFAVAGLHRRAEEIAAASGRPETVKREYHPEVPDGETNNFPCSWRGGSCPVLTWCLDNGDGAVEAAPNPFGVLV